MNVQVVLFLEECPSVGVSGGWSAGSETMPTFAFGGQEATFKTW